MKILSNPEGDGLLTNAEVREWLKEKKFETERRHVPEGVIKPPPGTASISKQVRKYIEASPAGNVSMASIRTLYERLEKFKLSSVEKLMIANIRPEAYAHLTPLIVDAYSRYDEDQLYSLPLFPPLAQYSNPLYPSASPGNVGNYKRDIGAEDEADGMGIKWGVAMQETTERNHPVTLDGQAVQTAVKEEANGKTEDTVQLAINAVNAVDLSSRGPSNPPS
ncbi:RNA polymerase Rpb4 [Gracilaria domingensis]|nr:RNA polymerase Rpb4 [Gracilaria domingensis]